MADPWLLDVPAQEAYEDGTLVEPSVRHWDFKDGFDISYNSTTGRIEIRGGGGGFDWQESVRLATVAVLPNNTRTGNVLVADAVGALSVDGVAAAVDDRILVKNEALGANNGIYVVDVIGDGATNWQMTRAVLSDESNEITNGLSVFISSDSATIGDQVWVCTTADPITVNTTSLTFSLGYVLGASIVGPASSTDNAIARWDGATGQLLQDSTVTVSDAGIIAQTTGAASLTLTPGAAGGQIFITDDASVNRINVDASGDVALSSATTVRLQVAAANMVTVTSTLATIVPPTVSFAAATVTPVINQADETGAGNTGDLLTINAQDATGGGGSTGGSIYIRPGSGDTDGDLELHDGSGIQRLQVNSAGNLILTGQTQQNFYVGAVMRMQLLAGSIESRVANFFFRDTTGNPNFYQKDDTTVAATGDLFTIHAQDMTGGGGTTGGALDIRPGSGDTNGVLNLQDGGGNDRLTVSATGDVTIDSAVNTQILRSGVGKLTISASLIRNFNVSYTWSSAVASPRLYQEDDTGAGNTGDLLAINAQDATGGGGSTGGALDIRPGSGDTNGVLSLQDGGGNDRLLVTSTGNVTMLPATTFTLSPGGAPALTLTGALMESKVALWRFDSAVASPQLYQETHADTPQTMTIHAMDVTAVGAGGDLDIRPGQGIGSGTDGQLALQSGDGTDRITIFSTGDTGHVPTTEHTIAATAAYAPIIIERFEGAKTTNATVTTAADYSTTTGEAIAFTVEASFRSDTDGDSGGAHIRGYAENTGGALTIVGSQSSEGEQEEATWGTVQGAPVIVDTSGADLRVRVEGVAADTVCWSVYLRVVRHQTS